MGVEMTKQIVQNSSAAAQDDAKGTIGIDQRTHRIFDCAAAILGATLFAPIILIVTIAINTGLSRSNFYSRTPARASQ